jgi:hypothetical protein
LILFWGNTWSDKMSNQKRIGLEGTIKAYAYTPISDNFFQSLRAREAEWALGTLRDG